MTCIQWLEIKLVCGRHLHAVKGVAHMGKRRGVYRVTVGKPEGKRPLGRTKRRWEDNIKVVLQQWDVRVWTGSC
jgi:hypothetical protein